MARIPEITVSSHARTMPVIGMGTSASPPAPIEIAKAAIIEGIKAGYRHFDTAFAYQSEQSLGEAIAEALRLGLIKSRDELFVTTKLWPAFTERDSVVPAIKMSLKNLQLDYVDLFLIHWPVRFNKEVHHFPIPDGILEPLDIKSVWQGMEECHNLGLAKAIGVSNFSCKMLDKTLAIAKIPPAVNQVELNPLWQQKQLREFCKAKGITIVAYSPLGAPQTKWGDNRVVGSDVLAEIAKAKGKSTAQVSLRWVYEQGVGLVTKSYNKERMKENLDIFDWSLTEEESNKISQLPQQKGVLFADIVGPHALALEMDAEV